MAVAWSTLGGGALGAVAAVADGRGGPLADLLSVPGPWIAAAALVAVLAARGTRAWGPAAATSGFLLAGVAVYYLAKQSLTGATPGPLVVFWAVLAVGVGLVGGTLVAWCSARSWGTAAVAGAVAGWLAVEVLLVPSAPPAEAVMGAISVGITGRGAAGRAPAWHAAVIAAAVGAAVAVGVLSVLSRALSAAL